MAALLLFAPFSGNEGEQRSAGEGQEPVFVPTEPVNLRMLDSETISILITDLREMGSGAERPSMMTLIVLDATGVLYGVTLPAQTRALVDELDENGECVSSSYASLADAYGYGALRGRGFENLMLSVSRLFAGVPIDGCIALSARGVEQFIDNIGGVYVRYDHFSALTGGVALGGDTMIRLTGKRAYSYADSTIREVDVGALARQQEVLLSIYETIKSREKPYTLRDFIQDAQPWIYYSLSDEIMERLFEAVGSGGFGGLEILWGENRVIDGIAYRLPDKNAVKAFVLAHFYPEASDEEIYQNME